MRIAILTGGGDVPGLNPCIKAVTLGAVRQGWDAIIGSDGLFVGMTGFGASAPYKDLYRHFGITPAAYYLRLRLEHARMLLRQTPMPMVEVALATGFANASHFAHAYRAMFGRTPSSEATRPAGKATRARETSLAAGSAIPLSRSPPLPQRALP